MATLGYLGEQQDLHIRQGATFGPFTVTIKNPDGTPVDISQIQIRGHVRKNPFDAGFYPFSIVKTDPAAGTFEFSLPSEVTTSMPAGTSLESVHSQYVYDIELDSGLGQVTPLLFGSAKVFREVTR
jgi:hypothetical protein